MKILVLLAIIGIGYLLYRSIVIKREPGVDSPAAGESQSAETEAQVKPSVKVSTESTAQLKTDAKLKSTTETAIPGSSDENDLVTSAQASSIDATSTKLSTTSGAQGDGKQSAVKQADIESNVGQDAEREAVSAQAKAAQKAHSQRTQDVVQSDRDERQNSTPAGRAEPPLNATDAGQGTLPVPDQLATQAGALQETQEPLARHRLYQQIVDISYRRRSEENYRQALQHFAPAHIEEFSSIAPLLRAQNGGKLPQVTTFKHYASALTEAEQYDRAIAVCEQAREYDLKDGTKSGYVGRIERINKLKARGATS